MGRELRMVPKNWEHPKQDNGRYRPMFERSYVEDKKEWDEGKSLWTQGKVKNWDGEIVAIEDHAPGTDSWEDWHGQHPNEHDYMPDWTDDEKTHFQMYENTSEGTPISPVMETPESLAHWLADTGASAFGSSTATYEQWLSTIKRGFAFSAVVIDGKLDSGVAGM